LLFCSTGVWTQGLTFARQEFHHLCHAVALLFDCTFLAIFLYMYTNSTYKCGLIYKCGVLFHVLLIVCYHIFFFLWIFT
jgi:hypothetical protein